VAIPTAYARLKAMTQCSTTRSIDFYPALEKKKRTVNRAFKYQMRARVRLQNLGYRAGKTQFPFPHMS
jgi:hypothetical protein